MIDDCAIEQILASHDSVENKVNALIDCANENGGKDNIAVIIIEL